LTLPDALTFSLPWTLVLALGLALALALGLALALALALGKALALALALALAVLFNAAVAVQAAVPAQQRDVVIPLLPAVRRKTQTVRVRLVRQRKLLHLRKVCNAARAAGARFRRLRFRQHRR